MSYQVFARKFRPQTFDEVIGQEPITTTLKNAISKKRIAQSFLFTGPRGVGKTSTARIFAKALNCDKGPADTPCNKCTNCEEITQGTSLDVLEIDGASNRGVDEIRNLRENVKFKPARARYKIYIIDEVHMLTGEAFNALLKTLEEPPEHVKFIFATTEVHKVPLTILSRCQRFNFRRIPIEEVVSKLKEIAKKEKIQVDEASFFLIAKSSEGSLRDGESLLDQLASFGEGEIKEEDIIFSLGLTSDDLYFSILESIKAKDSKSVLKSISQIAEEGKDLSQFVKGLLGLFRNILVLKSGEKTEELVEATEDQLKRLQKLKGSFTREELLFALTLIQQLARDVRWSETPRFLIEACLLKLANCGDLRSIDEMLNELKSIGKNPIQVSQNSASLNTATLVPNKPSLEPQKKKEHFELKPQSELRTSKPSSLILGPSVEASPQDDMDQSATPTSAVTIDDIGRVWPELLEQVKSVKMSCGTFLSESSLVDVVDGFAVLGFPSHLKFHKEALEKLDNKNLIKTTLCSLLGVDVNVSFILKDGATTVQSVMSAQTQAVSAETKSKENDVITSALNIFEGSKVIHKDSN